jgi:hypothetical protein
MFWSLGSRSEYRRKLPENAVFQFGLDFVKCTQFFAIWPSYGTPLVPYLPTFHTFQYFLLCIGRYINKLAGTGSEIGHETKNEKVNFLYLILHL